MIKDQYRKNDRKNFVRNLVNTDLKEARTHNFRHQSEVLYRLC